jgi:hypothetical protein
MFWKGKTKIADETVRMANQERDSVLPTKFIQFHEMRRTLKLTSDNQVKTIL